MNTTSPNILWICTDQQRFDTIQALGNKAINTPHMDRLVNEGVTFTKAYCQSTVCTPSRASFLTGRYPRTTRATKNGAAYFPEDEVLVTRLFRDIGYTCGLVGKLHLAAAEFGMEPRVDDGYTFFKYSHSPRPDYIEYNDYQKWLIEQGVNWNEAYKGEQGGISPRYHQTTWCVNEALSFISNTTEPWLLSVNIYDPHPVFDAPEECINKIDASKVPLPKWMEGELDNKPPHQQKDYHQGGQDGHGRPVAHMTASDKRALVTNYYAMIELIDEQIGRLLDELERTGQREQTVIIFMSDHGEMLGDHGLFLKGAYFYEGLVHVPLIISWPIQFKPRRVDQLVELVDIAPTLLELTGQDMPSGMQGKSLLPLLTNHESKTLHKESVYCEFYSALKGSHENIYGTMLFDGRYKIIRYHNCEYGELYDLHADPNEYHNLWEEASYHSIKQQMILKAFDRSVMTLDPNPPLVGKY